MAASVEDKESDVFDAAVSLGPNCLAAYRIAKAGLKRRSFPFDIIMSGSDGWPAYEEAVWQAPLGMRFVVECLSREPPFKDYVSEMVPVPHINAIGNAGFALSQGNFIPSAHCHDDPRQPAVAETYRRRAVRLAQLLASSGYHVLFLYTLRLRDLSSAKHFATITRNLPLEIVQLHSVLRRRFPQLKCRLVLAVMGNLAEPIPQVAHTALEASLQKVEEDAATVASAEGHDRPWVAVERIADAPSGPHPMDGFWGDEDAWKGLFERYRVIPRDFHEECFASSTKAGATKAAEDGKSEKFQRFVDSLGMVFEEESE
eukprot:TRINITY_DN67210_c0_g1_i1.p1 TRINITY_DN67210_c0_g1~~TRINITY_DN67210_c0_g1_i1.p1  ORF type:complete len:327 (-),score=60.59 TRINITY_DN67210_c0_g1_i1:111-1055(-)